MTHVALATVQRVTGFSLSNYNKNGDEMKGTVPRPAWPAPATDTANQDEPPPIVQNRITRVMLDEQPGEGSRGYDPYNTGPTRPVDVWRHKPKRD